MYVDLKKAFDTVSHEKLYNWKVFSLLESYLTNRTQMVKIENFKSEERLIQCGIPQGTVLGPILFNIHVNGLWKEKET